VVKAAPRRPSDELRASRTPNLAGREMIGWGRGDENFDNESLEGGGWIGAGWGGGWVAILRRGGWEG
jgi:hypothetical protein